jgi:hypothetical protein
MVEVANTLAYYDTTTITVIKSYIIQAHSGKIIVVFTLGQLFNFKLDSFVYKQGEAKVKEHSLLRL